MFFEREPVLVVGASGGIGSAFVSELLEHKAHVFQLSRKPQASFQQEANVETLIADITEDDSLAEAAKSVPDNLALIVVASGILHQESGLQPERKLEDLSATNFITSFQVNTIGPALVAKHFYRKLRQDQKSVFAALSARVGSIEDNRLGGWYSYRASKAALNMVLKNISLELRRKNKEAIVLGLHPGTVDTKLSQPFQSGVKKLFSPQESVRMLLDVVERSQSEDSGRVFAYDGRSIEW